MEHPNRLLGERFYGQVLNERRLDVLDEIMAVDFVEHGTPAPDPGRDGFRAWLGGLLEVIPDLRFTVEDWVVTDDRVVARGRVDGTHRGEFLGIAATGRPVHWTAIHVWRVADGRLAERWSEADLLGVLEQLG